MINIIIIILFLSDHLQHHVAYQPEKLSLSHNTKETYSAVNKYKDERFQEQKV